MAETKGQNELSHRQLAKCPTGIEGLDAITVGPAPGAPPWVRRRRLRQDPVEHRVCSAGGRHLR